MISSLLLGSICLLYFALLFFIAFRGDKVANLAARPRFRAATYAFSIAVYCSSWTFFGATEAAAQIGWGYISIFLGPAIAFTLGAPLFTRLIRISQRHNSTSIADFIASRYGKSQLLAVLVTIIAIFGVLPYIALQFKAVSMGFSMLTDSASLTTSSRSHGVALAIAMLTGLFAVIFGVRHVDATAHHQGLIQAIAFQSVVKLVAFIAVGLFVSLTLFDGWGHLTSEIRINNLSQRIWPGSLSVVGFFTYSVLGALAVICLPRQFHVTVVENHDARDMNSVRWAMPLYLLAMTIFVLPITAAGLLLSENNVPADSYLLWLPLQESMAAMAVIAFLGGCSAAIGMIIMATVTLSTMISNEILAPLLLRIQTLDLPHRRNVQLWLLSMRRISVFVILAIAFGLYWSLGERLSLASIGLLSFIAVAQFAPSLLGGILWRYGNRQGAIAGLIAGFVLWLYTLLLPILSPALQTSGEILHRGLFDFSWLTPTNLFFTGGSDLYVHGALWSLGCNLLLYIGVSALTTQRMSEKIQVASFLDRSHALEDSNNIIAGETTVDDLMALAERFLGKDKVQDILASFSRRKQLDLHPKRIAPQELIKQVEKQLASAIGSSTARIVFNSAIHGQNMQIEDVVSIVDEASQVIKFNRELLQAAIENMNLGVSVVDEKLNVVAWNSRYVEIFNYPKGFMRVGRPVADLLRYNLLMNQVPAVKAQQIVMKRLEMMISRQSHEYERMRPDGSVILIQGSPMPGGGFVTTFSDISAMRRTELALKETNTYLEERVRERTEELSKLNTQLVKAKSVAEIANQSKTRFLASASHDLLQPLNAARLFSSALASKIKKEEEYAELVTHIDSSLNAAEEILSTLLDISKLDAGAYEPHYSTFCIGELLRNLNTEFSVIAEDKNLTLKTVACNAYVNSDQQLLRRVVQNFLTNAIRYTKTGRILLGCRRRGDQLRIEVWDTGPGIPQDQLESIFEEFKRLSHGQNEKKGLGLGLAIVDRISRMLGYQVEVTSTIDNGSMFSVSLPMAEKPAPEKTPANTRQARSVQSLSGTEVFCIDNEPAILEGMKALLEGWGCQVYTGMTPKQAEAICSKFPPEIILADYQLDDGKNGLDTMDRIRKKLKRPIPGILVTAVNTEEIKEEVRRRGYQILHKPIKPAGLRAMINKVLKSQ